MTYQHQWIDGSPIDLPVGKAVCVGRNYAAHAKEMNVDVPSEPLLFMKPSTAFRHLEQPIAIPSGQGALHHEVEMLVLIGNTLRCANEEAVHEGITGFGIGLDLTLRDLQSQLKKKGHPWERSKAFDGAAPVSGFIHAKGISMRQKLQLSLAVNGEIRQKSHTGLMLFPIFDLISRISHCFTLEPGDVVFTGTPEGVGPLTSGDTLQLKLGNILNLNSTVA